MPIKDCFDKLNIGPEDRNTILGYRDARMKGGLEERVAELEALNDFALQLNKELNIVRQAEGLEAIEMDFGDVPVRRKPTPKEEAQPEVQEQKPTEPAKKAKEESKPVKEQKPEIKEESKPTPVTRNTQVQQELKAANDAKLSKKQKAGLEIADQVLGKVRENAPKMTDKQENELFNEIKAENNVRSGGKNYKINWTDKGIEVKSPNGKVLSEDSPVRAKVITAYKSRVNKVANQAVEKANKVDFNPEQSLFKPGEVKGSRLAKLKSDQKKVAGNLRKFARKKGRVKSEEQKMLQREYNRLEKEINKELEKRSGKKPTEKPVDQKPSTPNRKGLGERFTPESVEDRVAEELSKGVKPDGIVRMLGKNRTKDDKGVLLNYSDKKSGRDIDEVAQQIADEFNTSASEVMNVMESFMQENPKSPWDYIERRVSEQEDAGQAFDNYMEETGQFDENLWMDWLSDNDVTAYEAMVEEYLTEEQIINEQLVEEYGKQESEGVSDSKTQGTKPSKSQEKSSASDDGNNAGVDKKQQAGQRSKGSGVNQEKTKKEYSTVESQKSLSQTERVQPASISSNTKKPKKLKEITLNLAKGIGQRIFKNRTGRRNSIGSYNPRTSAVVVRYRGDLDTTAHEIGHALDDRFGMLTNIPNDQARDMRAELMTGFSEYGSTPPKGVSNPDGYRFAEGFAEWVRAFVVNPDEAIRRAPVTYARYQEVVPEKIRERINEFSDDVRVFVSNLQNNAHDVMMANIEMEPETKKDSIWDVLKPSSTDGSKFRLTFADRMKAVWINSLQPFNNAVKYAMEERGGGRLRPQENPEMLARLFLGVSEKFDNVLEKGWVDSRNKRLKDADTGKPINLEFLLAPFDQTDEQTLNQEINEAVTYMVAQRTLEKKDQLGKEIISGVGGGVFKDAEVAQKRLDQFDQLPKEKQDRIKEAARRYRVFADAGLQYMVEKGRLSEEQYEKIKADNTQYVAMQRILDAGDGEEITIYQRSGQSNKLGLSKEPIKTFKGSSRAIDNPYAKLLDSSNKMLRESDRNEVLDVFTELLTVDRGMNEGQPSNMGAIGTQVSSSGPNTIKVFKDGEAQYWQLDQQIYDAIMGLTDTGYKFPRFATAFARLLRWTVTHAPQFAVRNRIRDVESRLILSRGNAFSGFDVHFPKNKKVKEAARNAYQLFGGGQSGYHLLDKNFYHEALKEQMQKLSKSKNTIVMNPAKLAKKAWKGYEGLIEGSEKAGRLEEFRTAYKKAKGEGMDDYNAQLYAAYQARDIMDFAVAGTWMKVVNQVIPFSNAAVQGLRRSAVGLSENPSGFLTKVALYSIVPAIVNRLIVSAFGEEKEKEYEDLPAYQRDLFYNIPLTDNLWMAIPKPFELGMFGSFADRLTSYSMGDDKAFEGHAGSVARSVMPFDETSWVLWKPLAEVSMNRDFFRGKSIIPQSEERKKVALRDTEKASRLGKALQSISLNNMDARMADQFIKSSTSYFGTTALKLSDIGREDSRYQFNLSDLGVFKQSPAYNSAPVQWVLENYAAYNLSQYPQIRNQYQAFNDIVKVYFNATDDKQKEQLAATLRDFSKELRAIWEEAGLINT